MLRRRLQEERQKSNWLNRQNKGGKVSPRKSVVQSVFQYDVTSRVSDFQNGEQSVHRKRRIKISNLSRKYCSDFLDLEIVSFLLSLKTRL